MKFPAGMGRQAQPRRFPPPRHQARPSQRATWNMARLRPSPKWLTQSGSFAKRSRHGHGRSPPNLG
jgi:hypothetical protein